MSDLLGVVLAGGGSRRFGSPKALAELGGRTLARRAVDALTPVVASVVAVVNDAQVARAFDVPTRPDVEPGLGPAGGLLTALEWAREEGRSGALILACDLPLVSRELLLLLADRFPGDRGVIPWGPGPLGFQPLCGVYPVGDAARVRDRLTPADGPESDGAPGPGAGSSMERLVAHLDPEILDEARVRSVCDPRRAFFNVNSPADLDEARELLEPWPPVVCVVGWKDSGKTTVAVKLMAELAARGHSVQSVKHGHNFDVDTPGTDSWRHRHHGGAERVLLAGPENMALMGAWGAGGEPGLGTLVARYLGDADIVVAEGFKNEDFPKIEVRRRDSPEPRMSGGGQTLPGSFLALVTDADGVEADASDGVAPAGETPTFDVDGDDLARRLADLVERELLS